MNLLSALGISLALSELKEHKYIAARAAVCLLAYSLSSFVLAAIIVTNTAPVNPSGTPFAGSALLFMLTAIIIGLICVGVLVALILGLRTNLTKRVILLRMAALVVAALVINFVKSLALGLLADIVLASDPNRFEMAKTAIDHLSGLLGVALAAVIYYTLVCIVREQRLSFAGIGRGFWLLFFWIGIVYLAKTVIFGSLDVGIAQLAFQIFETGSINLWPQALLLIVPTLSTLASLWFFALSLGLQKQAQAQKVRKGVACYKCKGVALCLCEEGVI